MKMNVGLALSAAFCSSLAVAGPQGGQVTQGAATIVKQGSATRIVQSTAKAAINWQGFGIASGETVDFDQPNTSSITLNRVIGNERSVIDGALNANGKVFLINSNGVLFSKGSSVNTAGLVASTLDLSDADFEAGRYVFKGDGGSGAVVNQGSLTAAEGGYVALLGRSVSNQGVIVATKGTVALGSGRKIRLDFDGDALLGVSVDEGTLAALVENRGAALADGGKVILTAKAADELLGSQVNNGGILRARTLGDLKGEIVAQAVGGTVTIDGMLDASATAGGDGGRIETSGTKLKVADSATITTRSAHGETGAWIVDPDGFTVGSGGDISGAALGAQLGNNNVTLSSTRGSGTGGDITINEPVNWAADTRLTLNATHDIEVNAPITATGAHAGLAMNYGGFAATGSASPGTDYHINNITTGDDGALTISAASVTLSGAGASLSINGTPYTLIHSMAQLAALSPAVLDAHGNPVLSPDTGFFDFTTATGNFALARDLDASGTTYRYAVVNTLNGTLAGLGHSISHLTVSAVAQNQYLQYENAALIGSFGADPSNQLRDIGLTNVDIAGGATAAGLAGSNFGSISNVYVTGTITGSQPVAGVVGWNWGTLTNAHADVTLSALAGGNYVGGLAGFNGPDGFIGNATVKGVITTAAIDLPDGGLQASSSIGGLVGLNAGAVDNAHANVTVTATNSTMVGGLVGENLNIMGDTSHAVVTDSTAIGKVDVTWTNTQLNGQSYGGLIGDNSGGFVSHSSAAVDVTAHATTVDANGVPWFANGIGGLVGTNATSFGVGGTISDSVASGAVTGIGATMQVGGAVGLNVDGSLSSVRATGNVGIDARGQDAGGLVGYNSGAVQDSSATGSVPGKQLVGNNNGGIISNSTYHDVAAEAAAAAAAAAAQAAAEAAARAAAAAQAAAEAAAAQAAADAAAAQAAAEAAAARAAAAQAAALQARINAGLLAAAAAMSDAEFRPARPPGAEAAGTARTGGAAALLDANIVIKEPRRYSANVRRIEVDGQVFEVDDEPAAPRPPAPAASH